MKNSNSNDTEGRLQDLLTQFWSDPTQSIEEAQMDFAEIMEQAD